MRVEYRKATIDDIPAILKMQLRKYDIDELAGAYDQPWATVLENSVRASHLLWIGTIDERIIAVFGLGKVDAERGMPWLLATEEFTQFSYRIGKHSKIILNEMFKECELLYNIVSERNTQVIKWLEWLGFTMLRQYKKTFRDAAHAYIPFYIRRKD